MKVRNYVNGCYNQTAYLYGRPLKYCPQGTCCVNEDDEKIELQSYKTIVITIDKINSAITCTGTYSQTTAKHIGAFLKEYAPKYNYYDMKRIALTGEALKI